MDLLSDEIRRDPYPVYERLRAVAPVLPFGPAWVLLDHASVSRALREPDVFGSEVVPPTGRAPDWLIFTDMPRHGRQRADREGVHAALGRAARAADPAALARADRGAHGA